jgi:hypothetical protein
MVLRDPAEIDPDSRQRMYQLPELAAAQEATKEGNHEPEASHAVDAPGSSEGADPAEPEADAVDVGIPMASSPASRYLRSPNAETRWRWIAGVAVTILAVIAVLGLTGQFAPGTFLGNLLNPGDRRDVAQTPSDREPESGIPEEQLGPPSVVLPNENDIAKGGKDEDPLPAKDAAKGAGSKSPADVDVPNEKPKPGEPAAPTEKGTSKRDIPEPPEGTEPDAKPVDKRDVPPKPGSKAASGPAAGVVAAYKGPHEILLKVDRKSHTLHRLTEQSAILPDDRLLSLPAFRPGLVLPGKLRAELVDGTMIQIGAPDPQGACELIVDFGRLILKSDAGESRIRLKLGDLVGTLTFQGAESAVAFEAVRHAVPGKDPETEPGPLVADLYVASGTVTWKEGPDGRTVPLKGPDWLPLGYDAGAASSPHPLPAWANAGISPLDQRATYVIDRGINPDRPAVLQLRLQLEDRRMEVRKLALRSLAVAGDYEPVLKLLDDSDANKLWLDCIDQLRESVRRAPELAAAVRTAAEKRYDAGGADLYSMLWKYAPETVRNEDLSHLLDNLDHDRLAFRVLAWWNLRNITHMTIFYRPEDTALRRQGAVQKWRERMKTWSPTKAKPGAEKPNLPPPDELLEGDAAPEKPAATPEDGMDAAPPADPPPADPPRAKGKSTPRVRNPQPPAGE